MMSTLSASRTPVAVDFETTRLSPWAEGARLLTVGFSISVENGWCIPIEHIAARWDKKALAEVKASIATFLTSPAPKVIQNWGGMEEPWSVVHLGVHINNVVADTMVCEHVLDNRQGVCSQEFQTYVATDLSTRAKSTRPP